MKTNNTQHGFTLIELMITVAIIATLTAIALPSYTSYVVRSKLTEGSESLATVGVSMNQYFADNGTDLASGSTTACGRTMPTSPTYMTYSCVATASTFTATMTGTISNSTYTFTLDQLGNRGTTSPVAYTSCWKIGNNC